MKKTKSPEGFTDRLLLAIGKKDIYITELARLIGMHRSTIYSWMTGVSSPDAASLAAICRVLDVSADWLIFGENNVENNTTGKS